MKVGSKLRGGEGLHILSWGRAGSFSLRVLFHRLKAGAISYNKTSASDAINDLLLSSNWIFKSVLSKISCEFEYPRIN